MDKIYVIIDNRKSADKFMESETAKEILKKNIDENIEDREIMENGFIIHLSTYDMFFLNKSEEKMQLSYLHNISKKLRVEEMVIRSNNLKNTIDSLIEEKEIKKVFLDEEEPSYNMREIISILRNKENLEIVNI